MNLLLLDKSAVAVTLSLAPKVAEQLMASGVVPIVEIDGHQRVRAVDLQDYVARLPLAGAP